MAAEAHLRSLYRSILRELPARSPASKTPSPLRTSIRKHFADTSRQNESAEWQLARRQEADQFIQYLQAQRMYGTLIERYNPGMTMSQEEKIRLTARRVGMEMPAEWYNGKK